MSKKDQVFALFAEGKKPSSPEVKALGLAAKSRYNYYQQFKSLGGAIGPKEKEGKQVKGASSSLPPTTDINTAQVIRFQPHVITCPFTPIMAIARQVVTEEWNWSPDIRFEDFLDTILYHFFKDRGIILQGYVVEGQRETES